MNRSRESFHERTRQNWMLTFSIFSIITPFTSETWAFTLASLLTSSGWSTQYCICSLNFDLCLNLELSQTIMNTLYTNHSKYFNQIPKFLVKTIGRSRGSLSPCIFRHKIILNTLQKCNRHLSSCWFSSNYTVCCNVQRQEKRQGWLFG